MPDDNPLTTTEEYLLAELLALGNVSRVEHERVSDFSRTVKDRWMNRLDDKGALELTLYEEDGT